MTRCALRLAPLVFVSPGELRHAEWAEVDLEELEWRIPATKTTLGSVLSNDLCLHGTCYHQLAYGVRVIVMGAFVR